jgi:hypothetical protein
LFTQTFIEGKEINMATDADTKIQGGNDDDKEKIEFTPTQQEFIQKLLDDRFAKVKNKHEKEVADIKKELEDARKKAEASHADDKKDDKKTADDDPQRKQFQSLLDAEKNRTKLVENERDRIRKEAEEARSESMRIRKEVAIGRSASKQNFYDLEAVTKLVWDNIEYDEDSKTFVVKENGTIKQNSSLQPVTLDEHFSAFAAQRPYLVNGDMKSGADSKDSNKLADGNIKSKVDLKTAKDKSEYIKKYGLEKFEALPSGR